MPSLDLSAAFRPEMLDTFAVIRRPEEVNDHGESEVDDEDPVETVGVVTFASPTQLERLEDEDRMGRVISVVTQYKLRAASREPGQDWKPDQIEWPVDSGELYEVKDIQPYVRYGSGFVQALAASIAAIEAPPA